jgi:hypothetical protein
MNRIAIAATGIVLLHQVIATVHGLAHRELGVGLDAWQQVFVGVVITLAPLAALVLYWTRYAPAGALLLGLSMSASLAFGVFYHFIAMSPDHVSHLPEGDAQGLFVLTAILLIPAEILGAGFGFWSWTKLRQKAN